MIEVYLKDAEYQKLTDDLTKLQVQEMIDQQWYPEKVQEIKDKILVRKKYLKAIAYKSYNMDNTAEEYYNKTKGNESWDTR